MSGESCYSSAVALTFPSVAAAFHEGVLAGAAHTNKVWRRSKRKSQLLLLCVPMVTPRSFREPRSRGVR